MKNPQSIETETIDDSAIPIPPITLKIPAHLMKSSEKPLENLKKENLARSHSRKTTQGTLTVELLSSSILKTSPTQGRKSLKPHKKHRNASVNLSKSFYQQSSKSKAKLVKCDLKKGSFSDKQKVNLENCGNGAKVMDRKSISPFKKLRYKKANGCFQIEDNKKIHIREVEDRKKNWRMAMREIDNRE